MQLRFEEIRESDLERLASWLQVHDWPYHRQPQVTADWVRERAAGGYFYGSDATSFWALDDASDPVGVLRVFDLSEVTPLVDLRIATAFRGKGVGTSSLRWLTEFVFDNFQDVGRIGGYTRCDNAPMRRVFDKCGYVQEAHHRQAWFVDGLAPADCVGYAVLRCDWSSGTTTPVPWP
jgi:RimJ/RimL family protein N-acetyltransferase